MAKVTPRSSETTILAKTKPDAKKNLPSDWWNAGSKKELSEKLLSTVGFLKEQNQARCRQASIYARLYGNMALYGSAGMSLKMNSGMQLPIDRPTMSVITSGVDTLISRLSQSKPRPIFLTDNSDYKQRKVAKQMNQFLSGELFQTKAYELGPLVLRDASVLGTGCVKVLRDLNKKVRLERRLCTDLLVDPTDSFYGEPRQLYEPTLVERSVLLEMFPKYASLIEKAEQAYPDNSSESTKTVSDLVMVAEGWHLASGPDSKDGQHAIVCSEGVIFDNDFKKKRFPFAFLQYAPRMVGFWGQGLPERQMGTQIEINKLLMTISTSINLVGVPRVFVEEGSKVVKAHLNNMIGAIVTYRGTKPIYEVAPCVPVEIYEQLQRLIQYAYQQEGISQLAASSLKPGGLQSGEALREYNDIQSDRFAALNKRYDDLYVDLGYLMLDEAAQIAKDEGSYQTIFPDKNGTKEIDLPAAQRLEENPFVLQCYDVSSLPRDPAGRAQRIIEFMQAGIYSPQEGRRLLNFADTEQIDKLEIAAEERIFQVLDQIVDEGIYTPPDPFMDLGLAEKFVVDYYNLYVAAKLEEEKAQMLRNFFSQIQAMKQQASGPPPGLSPPQATPMALPQNPMLPNAPQMPAGSA